MTTDVVTVGGLPGTGTSTLCRLLSQRLGLRYVYAGQIFRDEAQRRGMSLADFGRLCQEDPRVDLALDEEQVRIMRSGPVLMEGRMSGWLAYREAIPSFRVWLRCDDDERVRRLVERDGGELDAQRAAMLEREASEVDRYRRYHGIDVASMEPYDLVLDSTARSPEALALDVVSALPGSDASV